MDNYCECETLDIHLEEETELRRNWKHVEYMACSLHSVESLSL